MGRREVTAAPSLEEEFLAVIATEEELLSFGDTVSKLPMPHWLAPRHAKGSINWAQDVINTIK